MGVEFNSIQHPSIQFATPFNSLLEGGIVEGVHCPALCESVHTFWAPSGYICNIENYAGLSCLLALLLLFVWTNFPTHLTCARPNTLLMLMTDGPKDDDDDCRMDDGPRLLFESVRNNLIFCGHLGKLCIIMDLMMMSETDERTWNAASRQPFWGTIGLTCSNKTQATGLEQDVMHLLNWNDLSPPLIISIWLGSDWIYLPINLVCYVLFAQQFLRIPLWWQLWRKWKSNEADESSDWCERRPFMRKSDCSAAPASVLCLIVRGAGWRHKT